MMELFVCLFVCLFYVRQSEFDHAGLVQEDERRIRQRRLRRGIHQLPIGADASAHQGDFIPPHFILIKSREFKSNSRRCQNHLEFHCII